MNHTEAVEMMLKNLDHWRHLPKYQLERRADVFFSLFIRQIVEQRVGVLSRLIIPEFPLRHNKKLTDTNHTVNVDYALFSEDCMYLVELKTDPDSYSWSQHRYLMKAVNVDKFEGIIDGIRRVIANTSEVKKKKYNILVQELAKSGFVSATDLKISKLPEVKTLYVGPRPSDTTLAHEIEEYRIDLLDVVNTLEDSVDEAERLFAFYLRRWNDNPAGSICCE